MEHRTRWVRHLPSGELSPVGEMDLERFEQDPAYEFLEDSPRGDLATAWEVYEIGADELDQDADTEPGWYVRPHGAEAAEFGPYQSEGRALGALRKREGDDVASVVTRRPVEEAPEPPTEE